MRRGWVGSTGVFAWGAILLFSTLAFAGADDRALSAAKELAKKAPSRTKLTIMQLTATKAHWAGAAETWKNETGIPVEFVELNWPDTYIKAMQEAVAKSGSWDIITSLTDYVADFAAAGLAAELDGWMRKYDPEWNTPSDCGVVPPLNQYGLVGGKYYGWMTDGDIWLLYLRKDLLEDPKEKEAFRAKYGYPLDLPKTWKEYADQVAFFDRPPSLRGAWLFRNKLQMNNEFFLRLYQKGGDLFDKDMNPVFNSSIGVSVLEEMNALNRHMDSITVTGDWSEMYTDFPAGKAYSAIAWPSLGAFANFQNSKVQGKVLVAPPPGTEVGGRLVRATIFVHGYGAVVSRHSKNAELAYLFLQYVNSPKVSLVGISQPGAFDPFRTCHFTHPPIVQKYPEGELKVALEAIPTAIPPFLLQGFNELNDGLNIALNASAIGQKTAKGALDEAAESWRKTIARYGKERSKAQWEVIQRQFPRVLQERWK